MPELPEVETIKRSLKPKILGKIIDRIEILSAKNFIGNKNEILKQKIIDVKRFGKILVIYLFNKKCLNFHLKLTGQILYAKNIDQATFKEMIPFTKTNKMPANTTRVIIKFSDHSSLFFNDLRKFGWIKITNQPLIPKGIDVLSNNFSPSLLKKLTAKTKKPIKLLLMDQDLITGIGNIYANEALFLAKIHPLTPSNQLSEKQIEKLFLSILKAVKQGIEDRGSSGADEAFILPDGSKGEHQKNFLVYQREGKPCRVCQTPIKRIKQGGRSSFFCPKCQKL
ncbi:MAG: bifunctional DNA-formamidopyrimidine glycosylase/DNA-(apurinic or apyrimidinic site) lyase [Microgenomates group bacterium]|nr:bifunctional DNA-formamidopyrimidine glycosylase/DNA-(apurinic or apyrimidinic site) lyase [Microgenomates group bacterium]